MVRLHSPVSTFQHRTSPSIPPVTATHEDIDDGDEEESDRVQITASQLDIEIMPTPQSSETLGSLIQEGEQTGPVTSDGYDMGGGPKIDQKKFLEEQDGR